MVCRQRGRKTEETRRAEGQRGSQKERAATITWANRWFSWSHKGKILKLKEYFINTIRFLHSIVKWLELGQGDLLLLLLKLQLSILLGNHSAKIALFLTSLRNVVYSRYVKPVEAITDFRTKYSGIKPIHMKKASDFKIVQKEVAALIKGRIIVGHGLKNDFQVWLIKKKRTRKNFSFQNFVLPK